MIGNKEMYKQIIDEMIPLHKWWGISLEEIEEGYAKIKIPFRKEFIGDPRIQSIHGGIIATALDSAGGAAGITTLQSAEDTLSTIDMRVDYLQRGRPEDFYVESKITRSGNRIIVTSMWAYHNNKSDLIAEGKGVYNVRRKNKL
ncbi:MAG: hotdog fold thioesterase [Chitinophagaceae bacterium]|nr:MAG: hotdog fold thioesterase [Chitinophagaceae bacterium]